MVLLSIPAFVLPRAARDAGERRAGCSRIQSEAKAFTRPEPASEAAGVVSADEQGQRIRFDVPVEGVDVESYAVRRLEKSSGRGAATPRPDGRTA